MIPDRQKTRFERVRLREHWVRADDAGRERCLHHPAIHVVHVHRDPFDLVLAGQRAEIRQQVRLCTGMGADRVEVETPSPPTAYPATLSLP